MSFKENFKYFLHGFRSLFDWTPVYYERKLKHKPAKTVEEALKQDWDAIAGDWNRAMGRLPLQYYMGLNYPISVYHDPNGGYVAEIKNLPGCLTQAETYKEVLKEIEDARRAWIEVAYNSGDYIPLPSYSNV
jgi:predicted RNase H-like HicB family nuclease